MKINIANQASNQQKTFDIEDDHRISPFVEKRMGAEVPGDSLGDQFKGYIFRITGGNDKQGFPMKQGVLSGGRVQLLFKKGMSCYRERRGGMRKRKSVRGCIVGHDLSILNFVIVKKGDAEIEGLTDGTAVKRLGPKRASKIRAMFALSATDDVKAFVVRRTVKEAAEGKKAVTKAPKIQRLITNSRLQRKRFVRKCVTTKASENRVLAKAYHDRVVEHRLLQKERRHAELGKKKLKKAATAEKA